MENNSMGADIAASKSQSIDKLRRAVEGKLVMKNTQQAQISMSRHMRAVLVNLNGGHSHTHHGTLNALVKRGLAETYRSEYGTEYRVTQLGRAVAENPLRITDKGEPV